MFTPAYVISVGSALAFSLLGVAFFAVFFAVIAIAILGVACRNAT